MARMMIGDRDIAPAASRRAKPPGEVRLAIDGLMAEDDDGEPAVRGVSLQVAGGEILGIAGVSGNGQSELVEVLAGQRRRVGGSNSGRRRALCGAGRAEMLRHGLSLLPEEPLRNACVGRMSVAENMAFRTFDRPPMAVAAGG